MRYSPRTMDSATQSDYGTLESRYSFLTRLRSWFATPVETKLDPRTIAWLCLSFGVSVVMAYGPLREAFSGAYVLQDDSRQHVFWMERFVDPDLFPHDFVVDYFQAVAPWGYKAFYRVGADVGIDPLLLVKLLPMATGLLTTLLCFVISMQLLPVPSAAFISALLLDQALWSGDSIVSSTPRAFMYPLLLLFLSSLLCPSSLLCLASIALLCLFYPPIVPIPLGIMALNLVRWNSRQIGFSRERRDYYLCAAAFAIAITILLPYAESIAPFGPVVSSAEARAMPEFLPGGRMVVFREGFISYWFTGKHTGMFASAPLKPIGVTMAMLLPLLWVNRARFQLAKRLRPGLAILIRVIMASLVMFFAAHSLLFKLYLPSRFTAHSFRIVLALSAGISAIVILEAFFGFAARLAGPRPRLATVSACLCSALVLFGALHPLLGGSPSPEKYKTGARPELYEFLLHTPKTAVVASLSREVDDLPVFSKRSILVGRETALPFHKRYYGQIRQRAIDLIDAQYTTDLSEVQRFIRAYGVSFLLLDRSSFTPGHLARDKWLMQFQPAANEAIESLRNGGVPVLTGLIDRCAVLETGSLVLLDAQKLLSISSAMTPPVEDHGASKRD